MLSPPGSTISRRQVCQTLFRHKKKMAAVFTVVMGLAVAVIVFMPRAYRSQGKLFVRLGRENATLDPTANFGQAPVVAVPTTRENDINSAVEILTSRFLIEKVVDAVGPAAILGRGSPLPPDAVRPAVNEDDENRLRAVAKMTRKLDVEAVKKSNIISINYDGPSPETAQAVVSRLIKSYLERYAHLHRTVGASRFMADQADRLRNQLERTGEELHALQKKTGLFAPEGQRQALVARLGQIEEAILRTNAEMVAAQAEVDTLRTRLAEMSRMQVISTTHGFPNQTAELIRGQMFTLKLKELEMRARQGGDHPDMRHLREQLHIAEEASRREEKDRDQVTTGPNKMYEEGDIMRFKQEVTLVSLKARAAELARQRAQEFAALETLNRQELTITRLKSDLELQTAQYRKYLESREQADVDQNLETEGISNISVVQPATRDADPVRPRPLIYLGVALVLAVLGSFGIAVLAENLDSSLKTPEEIEAALGIPVLTSIPQYRTPTNGAGHRGMLR
jgi:uncharacterized protein involved in exopolysaccharide biosynthesis